MAGGDVTLLDLGEVVTRVDTSGDECCGVVTGGTVVLCSGGVGRPMAVVGHGTGWGASVVHRAEEVSFWSSFSD